MAECGQRWEMWRQHDPAAKTQKNLWLEGKECQQLLPSLSWKALLRVVTVDNIQ